MSEIARQEAFIEKNTQARAKLAAGLLTERTKQEELKAEFGTQAEALFQAWQREQELQQQATEAKEAEAADTEKKSVATKQES